MSNEQTAWENRFPLICCSVKVVNLCSTWDVHSWESTDNEKNQNSFFKSVRIRLWESIRLRECVNTEFDWEVKTGIEKSVHKWSCPLTRVSVSGELTVATYFTGVEKWRNSTEDQWHSCCTAAREHCSSGVLPETCGIVWGQDARLPEEHRSHGEPLDFLVPRADSHTPRCISKKYIWPSFSG